MYTVNETGVLNNYATEPEIYFAEYPSPEQQRRYMFQGALAVLLVAGTILTALSVS
ncbi:photosystem II assembly protein Psb34 [Altericista sp. CCNU0014]|uniref:photosystem II assembly protein Psb34 n=1 Tax=Altericista sp. CCNU0014 TaxID=3082949 RepID=UPI0038511752